MSYPAKIFEEPKDPAAIGEWGIDWSRWLPAGELVVASRWEVPAGITKVSDTYSSTVTLIKLKDGTVGKHYDLTNVITTTTGLAEARTIRISVAER